MIKEDMVPFSSCDYTSQTRSKPPRRLGGLNFRSFGWDSELLHKSNKFVKALEKEKEEGRGDPREE